MHTLFILNESPYANEKSFNALRLAKALAAVGDQISIFLMADAVYCAKTAQDVTKGHLNIGQMLEGLLQSSDILMCSACMDARGLTDADVYLGAARSSMKALAQLTRDADKVLVF